MEVNRDGETETHVFVGAIKLVPGGTGSSGQEQIVHAGNAVRSDKVTKQVTLMKWKSGGLHVVCRGMFRASEGWNYAKLVLSMKPVAYYRMERPADPKDWAVLVDSAPSGRHGTLYGTNEFTEPMCRPLGSGIAIGGR